MNRSKRDSGIELYKIIAIAMIVISHVVHTIHAGNAFVPYSDYIIDLTRSTKNVQLFILVVMRYFGCFGNNMFFVCSAWFFLGSNEFKKRKWFIMITEVWIISVMILIVSLVIRRGDIQKDLIMKSLLPSLFGNNWYVTCYLIFYPLHSLLNRLIDMMDKKGLMRVTSVLIVLNCCLPLYKAGLLYSSDITLWITLYFVLAYLRRYKDDLINRTSFNLTLVVVGLIGFIGLIGVTDFVGLRWESMRGMMLHWLTNGNPFIIAVAIGGFGLIRRLTLKNTVINYFSGLTLLVYLIHENILVRTYLRPAMWEYAYLNYGYDRIVLLVLALSFVIFVLSFIIAVLYDLTIRRIVGVVGGALYSSVRRLYLKYEKRLLDK